MMYRSDYRKPRRRTQSAGSMVGTLAFVILIVGVFAYSVYQFRKPNEPEQPEETLTAEDAMALSTASFIPTTASTSTEATLKDVAGGGGSGQATRGEKDGAFYHTIKATLPEIDRERFYYEGWLVRPVPFDYFSTGEMVTNELGEFVLEWEGEEGKNYQEYVRVVITLEAKDGNPDPAGHILNGEFE